LVHNPRGITKETDHVVQVLRIGNPGELPVEQPTRFELVLNLEVAKAIGHEIPAGLVLRADKVIE
jgi:putative ABC transport system substrate-binding protein